MPGIVLKGITWGHSRGITPLLAASQRYSELHAGVEIQWKQRTLQEFADFPIEKLTREYDLLIIDHPWVGCAAATNCVLPLEQFLSKDYLDEQAANSVGQSHASYNYNNHQWALAIDAATPAASYREDLFLSNQRNIPATWEEVLQLASEGKVAVPAIAIDLLMNFYTFCIAHGETPFASREEVISKETGIAAIITMKQLYSRVDRRMFDCNPIAIAELMSATEQYWYCPFAYCYSNYARRGFANTVLTYADVVSCNGQRLRTTIGGTGLAVSAFTSHRHDAVDFAAAVVSPEWQRSIYVEHGGQPGHLSAWKNENANRLTNDFFTNVLPVMHNGYVRPRYNGYLHFQDTAGNPLRDCLLHDLDPMNVIEEMNTIYQHSLSHSTSTIAV